MNIRAFLIMLRDALTGSEISEWRLDWDESSSLVPTRCVADLAIKAPDEFSAASRFGILSVESIPADVPDFPSLRLLGVEKPGEDNGTTWYTYMIGARDVVDLATDDQLGFRLSDGCDSRSRDAVTERMQGQDRDCELSAKSLPDKS